MRRRLARSVILVLTLSACGSDVVVPPSPSPAVAIAPTAPPTARPTPRHSPSPAPSPGPSPTPSRSATPSAAAPSEVHCLGSDKTPGKPAGPMIEEHSSNWAGYVIYRRRTGVSCVEGSWVEPKVTCSTAGRQAVSIWVGIDGVQSSGAKVDASRTLVQVGTAAECRNGRVTHHAWREVLPLEPASVDISTLPVKPGDRFRAMVGYHDGIFTMRIENATTGGSYTIRQALADAPRQTAEWVVEAPSIGCASTCRTLPLARFSKVTFSAAYAAVGTQRASISDDKWLRGVIDLAGGGVVRSTVSALRANGTSFSATWRHR